METTSWLSWSQCFLQSFVQFRSRCSTKTRSWCLCYSRGDCWIKVEFKLTLNRSWLLSLNYWLSIRFYIFFCYRITFLNLLSWICFTLECRFNFLWKGFQLWKWSVIDARLVFDNNVAGPCKDLYQYCRYKVTVHFHNLLFKIGEVITQTQIDYVFAL